MKSDWAPKSKRTKPEANMRIQTDKDETSGFLIGLQADSFKTP